MKILLVNMSVDGKLGGGTAEKVVQTARALERAGEQVAVLTSGALSPERRKQLAGVKIRTLPLVSKRFWVPAPFLGRIREAVSWADVVIISNHWNILNLLSAAYSTRLSKPYVFVPSGALRPQGRSLKLKRLFNWAGGRRLVQRASANVATTPGEVEHFELYGIERKDVYVIPNAIETFPDSPDTARFRQKYALGQWPFILFVGRLDRIKGPDLLLAAFCDVADQIPHHLIMAGNDNGMLPSLRAEASRRAMEHRVHFIGFLSGNDKWQAYAAASLVVIPSREEAMSLVLLEAGLQARPVIVTDRCGVSHLAVKGLLSETSAESGKLAAAILEVISQSDSGRKVGERLRDYVETHYAWESVVQEYLDLFRGLKTSETTRH